MWEVPRSIPGPVRDDSEDHYAQAGKYAGVRGKSIPPGNSIPSSKFDALAFKNYSTSKVVLFQRDTS